MSDLGPTGEHVAQTVGKFREARNLGYAALSRRLAALGRKIPPLALRRIEAGERRVDVDDLVALAVALDVTPLALLLPAATDEEARLVPAHDPMPWQHIWLWATGQQVASGDPVMFMRDCNPLQWAHATATTLSGSGTLSATVYPKQNEAL